MKYVKRILKFGTITFVVLLLAYGGTYIFARFSPKLSIEAASGFQIFDNQGEPFSGSSDEWVSLDQISKHLIEATIAVEDRHFFNHVGFDYLRIGRSLIRNWQTGTRSQGASTITQQYAKNLFLDFDKTWSRKLEEAWLTIQLESHYTKEELLEGYLNTINYGGVFGIGNASYYYFGISASELDLAQATILAGIPRNPTGYSPINNLDAAKARQSIILDAMVRNNYITEQERNEVLNQELTFIGKTRRAESSTLMYFQDAVLRELYSIDKIPNSFLKTGGLRIFTTLDLETQIFLENSIEEHLASDPELEISSIVADPHTGKVLALVGGRDYSKSQFNRALSAERQVGSTLKPFLYYSALESGFTASTTFISSPTTFVFSNDQTYSPSNFADIYPEKDISMAVALAYSDNIYAVKTHLFLGEENLVNIAARVGIETKLAPNPSLALGTAELSMTEMIRAYSTLANGGDKISLHLIERVEDANGNVLYEARQEKENVLNKSTVFIINELLSNCSSRNFIDYFYPTCIDIAPRLTSKYAKKTGSTDTDALIFGFNNDVVMGIWVGYDDNRPVHNMGRPIQNIFADTVENHAKHNGATWYEIPSNVVGTLVNPITGEPATANSNRTAMVYFIKGTEPTHNINLDDLIPTLKEN